MWFAEKLAKKGHRVLCPVRGAKESYSGLRAQRLARLAGKCELAWDVPFGTPPFLELIRSHAEIDVLCHHAAEVKNYKSPDFDVLGATAANTHNIREVLVALREAGCRRIVLTGSVFEADEGAGEPPLRAFSAYGLSKTLTAQILRFHADQEGFALGKFVIANPFGPYEEPRFTDYLMRCWKEAKPAKVNAPAYVRDNIPVSLLAEAYARFVDHVPDTGLYRLTPSCYAESQGAFARRFANEMESRLHIDSALELAKQEQFPEPSVRIGIDVVRTADLCWSEMEFWDETAHYYADMLDIPVRQHAEQSVWRNS